MNENPDEADIKKINKQLYATRRKDPYEAARWSTQNSPPKNHRVHRCHFCRENQDIDGVCPKCRGCAICCRCPVDEEYNPETEENNE